MRSGEVAAFFGVVEPDAGDRHAGRHLHDREDRVEAAAALSRLDSGTPITGRSVCAAATPGSAADRPAPAMITRRPRMRALRQ